MTPTTPNRMVVVKKEDKEPKMRELLGRAIDAVAAAGRPGRSPILRLLVASSASPVAAALMGLRSQLDAIGVQSFVLVARPDQGQAPAPGQSCTMRHLADLRCHDAHELLVLDGVASWIGDSLRRDAAGRDSYELHAFENAEVAELIAQSFDKLWALGLPYAAAAAEPAVRQVAAMTPELAALANSEEPAPIVLTRH